MQTPAWAKRFWADLITKEFIPIKLLFFLIYGASMAMFPFLTLQARSLGITEKELGIVYAFNPVIAIVGPPLTGMIADKIGNFKLFLSITMAASGAASLVFSAVPTARYHHQLPEQLPFRVACGTGDNQSVQLLPPYQCDYLPNLDNLTLNITITNCTFCHSGSGRGRETEVVGVVPCLTPGVGGCESQEVAPLAVISANTNATIAGGDATNSTIVPGTTTGLQVLGWSCPHLTHQNETAYSVGERDKEGSCIFQCSATLPRQHLCSNTETVQVVDPMLTFWCYLLVRLLNGLTLATSFTLFDGAAMAILKEYKGEYGLQRLYGNLGAIVVTPVSGVLIDVFSDMHGYQDYSPAFYLYCCLKVVAAVLILFVNMDFREPSSTVVKDFRFLLRQPEILTFLLVMLVSGTCFGLLDTFLFWLLQDMGAQKYLMGITVTVGSLAGVPILIASGAIFNKLGHANTIVLGFAFYVVRMFGYSFITNPWWVMPFEALECFTVSLMGAAAVSYAAALSTPSTIATLQGVYGGIHFGVGRGVGSLMGGFLMGPIGVRNTFRLMGVICAVTCILYFVINRIFFRKLQLEREEKEKTEANENHTMEKNQNGIVENGTMKHKSNEEVKDAVKGKESDARVVNSGKGTYNEAFEKNE
nr:major facilitator superfamily domain-containing protein 6-A-like [Cherax quadricarinatus]XP_053644365.1 major facilitator superfamily domain-containing protein 6-A-like [Cherax quadricarinatus]